MVNAAETILGRKLFKGGNYLWKFGTWANSEKEEKNGAKAEFNC